MTVSVLIPGFCSVTMGLFIVRTCGVGLSGIGEIGWDGWDGGEVNEFNELFLLSKYHIKLKC